MPLGRAREGVCDGLREMTSACVHSARWRPNWDDTTSYEALPYWVDGRFAALPSVRGAQNASVGLCVLPKVASSRIKRFVWTALKRRGFVVGPDADRCPHRQPLIGNLAPPSATYLILRHPLMRVVSAWREIQRRAFWHRLPRAVARPNTTFGAALRAIMATRDPAALNLHLRPIIFNCGILNGRRYRILRYEQWDETTRVLQAHFAPHQPPMQYRASGTFARAHNLFSRALAQSANAWAEADLWLGGYAAWLPGQNVSFARLSTRTGGPGCARTRGSRPNSARTPSAARLR